METCKIQYLRGLAIIKNKVHYLQTISVLGLCTVGQGERGVCRCVDGCVCGGSREAVVVLVIMRKEGVGPVSGLSEKDGWLWEGGVRTEWSAQGNGPNVVGKGEALGKSGAKKGWGEVEPFLLGWEPRGQGDKLDPG